MSMSNSMRSTTAVDDQFVLHPDDVKVGIPARGAEITALRKETETLQTQLDADVLQGAADWLVKDCGVKYIAELARRLSIGYSRATRLMDTASKEQA